MNLVSLSKRRGPRLRLPTFDDLVVLYLHVHDTAQMTVPIYSARQVTAGPFTHPATSPSGAPLGFRTPLSRYDLAEALSASCPELRPEVVIVFADATRSNLPRNLGAVPGTKVLVVGDTQHLDEPLQTLVAYAKSEPFDVVISAHNRHHLHFFLEAGSNVAWLPNCEATGPLRTLPPSDAPREARAVTSGQIGGYHPVRARLVARLQELGAPLVHRSGTADELHALYAGSTISLNCSLNGDLNLRVGEVLAAGGCLLTDRLAPQSGFDLLFEDGRELVTYGSAQEASERIQYFLAHPNEALEIARRGWETLLFDLGFHAQRRRLLRLITTGEIFRPFAVDADLRCAAAELFLPARLPERLRLYERCQEQNRIRERTTIGVCSDVPAIVALDLIDLHRSRVTLEEGEAAVRLQALPRFQEVAPQIDIVPRDAFAASRFDLVVAQSENGTDLSLFEDEAGQSAKRGGQP